MMISHWRFVSRCSFAMMMTMVMMMPILRVSAFVPSSMANNKNTSTMRSPPRRRDAAAAASSTRGLYMAGFGAATPSSSSSSSSSSSGDSGSKLKAKTQWDRYLELKQEATSYIVGVKIVAEVGNDSDWLVVGQVRCRDEKTLLAAAVARQRGLLADHAKRLFPLKVTPQVKLAWGYFQADTGSTEMTPTTGGTTLSATGSWVVVDPKASDNSSSKTKDFDKSIGYEGTPDPSTGYYCKYNEGRLVGTVMSTSSSANAGGANASEPPMAPKKSIRPSSKSK
jgi:hypothetical protein